MKSLAGLLVLAMIVASCRSTLDDRREAPKSLPIPPAGLPPDVCRILGTVVRIDSTMKSSYAGDPCSKAPCNALVRVDSVLGYGSSFPVVVSTGSVIKTRFTFTVAPTDQVLPDVKPPYPGVAPGSRIRTDLKRLPVLGDQEGDAKPFTIEWYEVQ